MQPNPTTVSAVGLVPSALRGRGLNLAQKAVLAELWDQRGHAPGPLDISSAELGSLLECDSRSARRYLAELLECGEISEAPRPPAELAKSQTVRRLRVEDLRLPPGPARVVDDPQRRLFDADQTDPPDNLAQDCPDNPAQDCPAGADEHVWTPTTLKFFDAAQPSAAMHDASHAAAGEVGRDEQPARQLRECNIPQQPNNQAQAYIPNNPTSQRDVHSGVNGREGSADNSAHDCPREESRDGDGRAALPATRWAAWHAEAMRAIADKLGCDGVTPGWILAGWAFLVVDGQFSEAELWECVEAEALARRAGKLQGRPGKYCWGAIRRKLEARDTIDLNAAGLWNRKAGEVQPYRSKQLRRHFAELGLHWDRAWEANTR